MNLLIAPHGDDETLFAAYTCMRERPHIIVCTRDADPEVGEVRSRETATAIQILGCSHQEWQMSAANIDWNWAREQMALWLDPERNAAEVQKVYAPAVNALGHEQHNGFGRIAQDIFGDRVQPYLTYAPRGKRERVNGDLEIKPTTDEISRKLRAMAAYKSQIENPATRPWFFELLDLREWLA